MITPKATVPIFPIELTKTLPLGKCRDFTNPSDVNVSLEYLKSIPCDKSVGLKKGNSPL